ncbi:Putative LPS-induced tumor necrosis factor alpha factor [Septoria linicola]|uniref:LPS-induced tumor necrosis factor alpha factor n=1 Tax=Septoria linicola TaxID=215465 RepID=A0A9Q9B1P3_9PEZI|nr:putative LPS-induced tumor necrosis factor alpha factor [Septoria linicola]USW59030.1 Putative LPS-induced tumor necrosis factor alpha factor [Septoria linicola]
MATMTHENDHPPAPPYETPGQHPSSPGPKPIETINRGAAASPGPQMVMVPNVAPPQQQQLTQLSLLREQPEWIFCPQVGRPCQTRADSKDSDKTWFAVIGICLICPCVACIPLKNCCGDGMLQDWDHYCTGCGKQVTHRPYNKEAQITAPDHNVAPPQQGGQYQQPQMQYYQQQQGQPQYAQQQYQ